TYLPAGTYYVRVTGDGALLYTIAVTRTLAQRCQTSADCAAEYTTQYYRGTCTDGVCTFIDRNAGELGRGWGAPCDSNDDCAPVGGERRCSYLDFQSNAQRSVCTLTCETTYDCVNALGPGFTCTDYWGAVWINYCVPSCLGAFDCGADVDELVDLTPG